MTQTPQDIIDAYNASGLYPKLDWTAYRRYRRAVKLLAGDPSIEHRRLYMREYMRKKRQRPVCKCCGQVIRAGTAAQTSELPKTMTAP